MVQTDSWDTTRYLNGQPGQGVPEEKAVYCHANDTQAPTWIGLPDFSVYIVCPEEMDDPPVGTVDNADPGLWQVRYVFDELLDPDVETLADTDTGGPCTDLSDTCTGHLTDSQPFTLTCNSVPVAYDGYYVPNGSQVSWPPGPSLVVFPEDYASVPTGATCMVSLKTGVVVDKDRIAVPDISAQTFSVSGLAILFTDPEDGSTVAPDTVISIFFNARIDPASVGAGEVVVATDPGGTPVAGVTVAVAGGVIEVAPPGAGYAAGDYTLTIPAGSTFADEAGGMLTVGADFVVAFTVVP